MHSHGLQRLALFILLTGLSKVSIGETMNQTRIWDLLQNMRTTKVDERSVQELFEGEIEKRYGNLYWEFHEGKGPMLGDGVEVTKFGFMTKNDASAPPLIYMALAGKCVGYDEVKKAYPDMQWDGKGATVHSPRMVYLSRHADGETQFGFDVTAAMTPQCLVNVGFSPKK